LRTTYKKSQTVPPDESTAKTHAYDGILTEGIVPCYMMTQIVGDGDGSDRLARVDSADRSIGDSARGNRLIPDPVGISDNPREEL